VQSAVELVGGKEAAFVEQFGHGGKVGGSDEIAGTNFFLGIVGPSRFGRGLRLIHAHVLTNSRPMAG
jgi:hypothetical protein